MHNSTRSRVRIDICPGFNTEIDIYEKQEQQTVGQIRSDICQLPLDSLNQNYFFSIDLSQIKQTYLAEGYQQVEQLCIDALQKYQQAFEINLNEASKANLNFDISKIKGILALSYLRLYLIGRKKYYLDKAKSSLRCQYRDIQTVYKKGKRLNNLGLCQMFSEKYSNAFKYYLQAFYIYNKQNELNLQGLLKNIGEVYKQYEMYQQAIKCFQYIFQSIDKKRSHSIKQYTLLIISSLQCINQLEDNTLYLSFYQRAKQMLSKISKEKQSEYFYRAKIMLEMIKYSILFGIKTKSTNKDQVEKLFNEIYNLKSNQRQILFIKGECCFIYRQSFRHKNWHQYRQLSKSAKIFFKQSQTK